MDDIISLLKQAELEQPLTLDEIKAAQIDDLNTSCNAAIVAGFESSVLGTSYTYTLNQGTDQQNLSNAFLAAQYALTIATAWTAGATHNPTDVVNDSGVFYICELAGTSDTTTPAWPTEFQQLVMDGTTAWAKAGMLLSTTTGILWHTPQQIFVIWQQYLIFVNTCRVKYAAYVAAVNAVVPSDTAADTVIAIVWS